MNLIYYIISFIAFFSLPLALIMEFLGSVGPDIIFALLTISIFAFGYMFANTEGWKGRDWVARVFGVFSMGSISVYLTFKIILEHG